MPHRRSTQALLNLGHALDHMFLLVFATAVTAIARDLGVGRWEDLMPYGTACFFLFGLGSLPAGKLGDGWGRRPMMVVFFVGIGAAAIAVSQVQTPVQLALALALLGLFASIYHPVGIPLLVQGAERPGWTIGVNGLAGNLGLALAALVTGWMVKHLGWRAAFWLPGLVSIACGLWFAFTAPHEAQAPARRKAAGAAEGGTPPHLVRLFFIMTVAATSGSLLFNLSTNGNYELLADRLRGLAEDPALLGLLLSGVYALAALTQLLVGWLIDRHTLRQLALLVIGCQVAAVALAYLTQGWVFVFAQLLVMAAVFGATPFTDAMIVRYVDDRLRSRVSGMRLAVSLGVSSLAVGLLGPLVKRAGFDALLMVMGAAALITFLVVSRLPREGELVPARA